MPSTRKRIGYLPSTHIQEIIGKIATTEKLSQSKVVGILVEEALIARNLLNHKNRTNMISKGLYTLNENNMNSASFNHNDIDELISDNCITYNTRKYNYNLDKSLAEPSEDKNEELFEQFKQFILFQKRLKEKK